MSRPRVPRPATRRTLRPVRFFALLLLAVCPIAAAAEPSRTIPAKELAVYIEYDGLDAHADAWKATAVHAMFEGTPAGAMTGDIARQVIDHLLKAVSDQKQGGADLIALQNHILRHGFALGVYDDRARGASCVVVLNGLGRNETRALVGRLAGVVARAVSKTGAKVNDTSRFRGRDLYRVTDLAAAKPKSEVPQAAEAPKGVAVAPAGGLAWWFEGNDLIVVVGPTPPKSDKAKDSALAELPARVSSIIDTIEGKASSAATHPGRAAALMEGKDIKGFESDGLFFFEVSKAQGLYVWLSEVIDAMDQPYEGLVLPTGRYMHDDVKYITAGPEFPGAKSPAAEPASKGALIPAPVTNKLPPPTLVSAPPVLPGDVKTLPSRPESHLAKFATADVPSKPPVAEAPPKIALMPPPPLPAPRAEPSGQMPAPPDPAVSKTGIVAGSKPDLTKVKEVNIAKSLGLDGVSRVVGRWGFQGKALLTDVRVEAPAPHRGVVGIFDQPSFRKDRLPPIPRGAGAFLIGACNPVKAYEALISLAYDCLDVTDLGEDADALSHEIEVDVFDLTNQRLREDLIGHFGPAWCLYSEPRSKSVTGLPTLLVEVAEPKEFGKVLDSLAKRFNAQQRTPRKGNDGKPANDLPIFALECLPAPERGYRLTAPAGIIWLLGGGMEPTILIGESHVAVAANPTLARAALATASRPAERWTPSGELANAIECLPVEITSLTVGDPRDSSWPEIVAALPKLVQHVASIMDVVKSDRPGSSPGSVFLGLLGVPQAGGLRLRIDPANRPKADALKAQLFPSVMATAVDDRGIRFIAREAVPFACAGPRMYYNGSTKTGETVTVELRPFLFPSFPLVITYNSNEPGGRFTFGMKWKFTSEDDESDQ